MKIHRALESLEPRFALITAQLLSCTAELHFQEENTMSAYKIEDSRLLVESSADRIIGRFIILETMQLRKKEPYVQSQNTSQKSPETKYFIEISAFAKSIWMRNYLEISCRFHNIGLNNLAMSCNMRLDEPRFCHSDLSMA